MMSVTTTNLARAQSVACQRKDQNAITNIENQLKILQVADKALEMEMKNIETQHNAVQTEYDSVKKVIDKNIETSFKYFG